MPSITLPNGLKLEGTETQIDSALFSMGIDPRSLNTLYYKSETHGLILISEMDTNHLRNAVLKMYKEWVNSLYRIMDPQVLVGNIVAGPNDETFKAMLRELNRREE